MKYVVKLGPEKADEHTARNPVERTDGALHWVDTAGVPHVAPFGSWWKENDGKCQHITSEVRAVSVHSGMKVGARVSPTGNLWWCVGCGTLFSDEQGERPLAIPTSIQYPEDT